MTLHTDPEQPDSTFDQDRRHPRRGFEPALIADYLQRRKVASVQLMPLGKSNTNYRLMLTDGEACLLRLHHPGSKAEFENHILRLVRETVPVPTVLASGDDWSIHSFVEGATLAESPAGVRVAAEALGRLSVLRFPSSGWIQTDGSVEPFDFGDGRSFVESMLEHADVRTWIDADTAAALRRIEAGHEHGQQSDKSEPCLVHGDFNPTNILIHEGRVSGILDWEFAHAGNPYMDIGNLLRHTEPRYHSEIEAGLRSGGMDVPPDWRRRAELVDVSSHLEFLTTQRSDAFKQRCAEWIRAFAARY
jgi:aminoglycoside phosphotransferase (APT) family kinase protein